MNINPLFIPFIPPFAYLFIANIFWIFCLLYESYTQKKDQIPIWVIMTVEQVTMSAVVAQVIIAMAAEAVVLTHFSQRTWPDLVRKATWWAVEWLKRRIWRMMRNFSELCRTGIIRCKDDQEWRLWVSEWF